MEVLFTSTPTLGDGLASHVITNKIKVFKKGMYTTTDKEEVADILSSEIYRRGEVALVSDFDLVDNYLNGDEPEYLTNDVLLGITEEGIRQLSTVYGTKDRTRTSIIKAELRDRPITDRANTVINAHQKSDVPEAITTDKKREFVEAEVEAGNVIKAGPWFYVNKGSASEFKTRNYEEVYDKLTEK